jgi:parallel beta-helix repeat protein
MKVVKRLLFVFAVMAVVLSAGSKESVKAADYYNSVTEGTVDGDGYYILKADTFGGIQEALYEAEEKASASKKYKIVVKPQTYENCMILSIPGNTYLYAEGATFIQEKGKMLNMIIVGSYSSGGYDQENITIEGGTWDENGNSNTLAKIAHAKNFCMKGVTLKNTKNGHLMEVAGVDGFELDKCRFLDQVLETGASSMTYEAVQLDILVKKHFKTSYYEDLANRNIKVTGCTFSNVPRGIGSHTAVLNNPVKNIEIKNNTFEKISSCAVQFINVENCEVSGNTIKSAPRGITILSAVYAKQDTFLASTLAAQQGTSTTTPDNYITPDKNMKLVIKNNKITISGKDPYASYERCGIWVNGQDAEKAYKSSSGDTLPKGNYYLSGVTITGNTVKGNGHGVKIIDTRNCTVKSNKLTFTGKISTVNYYGVTAKINSKNIKVTNNTATGYLNNIYIVDSAASSLAQNTLNSAKKYGISVERSTVSDITKNKINKTKSNGIHIWDKSKVSSVKNNTLKSVGGKTVYVGGGSKASKITGNK